jgi:hypothetical protein
MGRTTTSSGPGRFSRRSYYVAIDTHDKWVASTKQVVTWMKTGSRTVVAGFPYTVFDIAGNPGGGTLAIGNTANGVVPTDAIAGYPVIPSFGGNQGRLGNVNFSNAAASRFYLYDRVFAAGAYSFGADTTLASQPSYSARMDPAGNYTGTQLWIEAVTAFTGNPTVQINYLDQDGAAGDTGAYATGLALPVGRMMAMPLASGDNGISQITRVRITIATAGTLNVMVLRKLWGPGRVKAVNDGEIHDYVKVGFPKIFEDSAFYVIEAADGTAIGLSMLDFEVCVGP